MNYNFILFFSWCRIKSTWIAPRDKDDHEAKSTFQIHFYYQILILLENTAVTLTPLIIGNTEENLPFRNLPKNWLFIIPLLMLVSWLLSNIFMIIFYKVFHPWKAINGSEVKGAVLCKCGRALRDGREVEELPYELDIDMDFMMSVGASCD